MSAAPPALLSSALRHAPSRTSYARARLRLGIACVGTLVVLSTVLLSTGAPTALLPNSLLLLTAAMLSFVLSVSLSFAGHELQGIFVGIWVPSILSLGGMVVPRNGL